MSERPYMLGAIQDFRFTPRILVAGVAIAMSLFQLAMPVVGEPIAEIFRPLHLVFALTVLFGFSAVNRSRGRMGWLVDIGLIVMAIASSGYLILNAEYLTMRLAYVTPLTAAQFVLGLVMLVVILVAAQRTVGWALVLVTAGFILYALFGHYLPDPFWHRRFSLEQIIERLYLTTDGIWGQPLGVTASYVFIFVLFGSFLMTTGGGDFFNKLATALSGKSAAGPAKTAVISSAFMGTLSGSTPANVVTTGSFTIPAMKARGFPPHVAAAIEAAASTGGQLAPPIMGTAAFIMVEFTAISYFDILWHALIPAVLYFLAVFVMVTLDARKLGITGPDIDSHHPRILAVLKKQGFLLVPLVVMIAYMALGYTPSRAAFASIITLVALTLIFDAERRRNIVSVVGEAMVDAPKVIGPVSVACACGGIIIGVVIMTGMGEKISSAVLSLSGGHLFLTLILTTVVSVILGMGMPTSGAYIILAALLAPGIVALGVPVVAVHLFLIYCASMSSITPPVAIASYAAAGIAGSDPWKTSVTAVKLAIGVFMVPYFFVYSPGLLMIGGGEEVVHAAITAVIGIFYLSIAISGFWRRPLSPVWRVAVGAAAALLVAQGWATDLAGLAVLGFFTFREISQTRTPVGVAAARDPQ